MTSIETMIKWMKDREGKVTYSMSNRNGPNSFDCSSAVYYALQAGGFFSSGMMGNTESLFDDLEKNKWVKVPLVNGSYDVKRGDIFIWGIRGSSNGVAGHTGIFVDDANIIHCNFGYNGITTNNYNSIWEYNSKPVSVIYRYSGTPPFVAEQVIPVGEISVGTNVYYQQGRLTNSSDKKPGNAVNGIGSAWVKQYLPGKNSPYLLMANGVNIGFTQRNSVDRVNPLSINSIQEGSNVYCNKYSNSMDSQPTILSGNSSYWVAQYIDGGKISPYRLVKDGKTVGYTNRDNIQLVQKQPIITEQIIPVGGISVGTNVYYQEGTLTNSSDKTPGAAVGGSGSAWVKQYLPGKNSPYLLEKNGINIGYTQRNFIARVTALPINSIPEGSNVLCNKYSNSPEMQPIYSSGYNSYWVAQYIDGNKVSPYRLLKDGKTVGYTNRDNIQIVK